MKNRLILVTGIFLISIFISNGQTMLIDEDFTDWTSDHLQHVDQLDDGPINSLDFHQLWIADDDENIYLRIEVGREIEIQEFDELFLYIDIDNNPNTGVSTQQFGADLVYGFGAREGILKVGNFIYTIYHNDINLVTLPTVSSNQFEISFSKTINYFQGQLHISSSIINVVLADENFLGDRIPDVSTIAYSMQSAEYLPPDYQLTKEIEDDLRIISYNVLSDGLFESDRQPAFRRIIRAMIPDIVCFQEVYDHTPLQVAQLMEVFLPSVQNEQWYYSGVNPDIIIASRYPISATGSSDGNGIFEVLVHDQKIVIADAHLPCCNNDEDRQHEVDRLMSFIRNSIEGLTNIFIEEDTPIFIVGDMNLVGNRQQQHSLVSGDIFAEHLYGSDFDPDWDGSSLDDVRPFATGRPHAVTWYNAFGSFPAGRLDYLLYTGSVVDLSNGFVLNTTNLSAQELNLFNLLSTDVETASDHLPCVMDVDLMPESGQIEVTEGVEGIQLYPNPATEQITLKFDVNVSGEVSILVIDAGGKTCHAFETVLYEDNYLNVPIKGIPNGDYILQVGIDNKFYNRKFVKN